MTGFHRRIPDSTQRQAITVSLLAVALVVERAPAFLLISADDRARRRTLRGRLRVRYRRAVSTGITPTLPAVDQLVLMVLMLVGRVGPITLGAALVLRCATEPLPASRGGSPHWLIDESDPR